MGEEHSAGEVRYAADGAVAVITVDRPAQRNAWGVACVESVIDCIRRANAAPDAVAMTDAAAEANP